MPLLRRSEFALLCFATIAAGCPAPSNPDVTPPDATDVATPPDATDIVTPSDTLPAADALDALDALDATTDAAVAPDGTNSMDALDATTACTDAALGTYSVGDGASIVRVPACAGFGTLSEYGLFVGNLAALQPAPGVIPYTVNSPLFADNALKQRFLFIPPGTHIGFIPNDRWVLPVGAMAIKTFYYPIDARNPALGVQRVETRILIHQPGGFHAETYLWNSAQTEALRSVVSPVVPVTWTDSTGTVQQENFQPPNIAQCGDCHGPGDDTSNDPTNILGIRTGELNLVYDYGGGVMQNQIDYIAALGWLDSTPPPTSTLEQFSAPFGADPVDPRARSYLQANCAHCHHPGTPRDSSGLVLTIENTDMLSLGLCKIPTMANGTGGNTYDIVPGNPAQSIMPYRMSLTSSTAMMPPLGSKALWIPMAWRSSPRGYRACLDRARRQTRHDFAPKKLAPTGTGGPPDAQSVTSQRTASKHRTGRPARIDVPSLHA